jgi:hypothetical protein
MPTPSEIEASARVLCRIAYFQLPANERICSADEWPDVDVKANGGRPNISVQALGDVRARGTACA